MSYSAEQAAERAGVSGDYFGDLVRHGIVETNPDGTFSEGAARRASSVHALTQSGVPMEAFAELFKSGRVSLDFLESPVYDRFAAVSAETFRQVSERTGVPLELLANIRETLGAPSPGPDDRVRDQELEVVRFLEVVLQEGSNPVTVERLLRVMGDSLRRVAETEAEWYYTEILQPQLARAADTGGVEPDSSVDLSAAIDQALLAMYHGQQGRTWTNNFIRAMGGQLADAGLHAQATKYPAICFLDITGYTRLTQERGDAAAANLAEDLARLVQRTSVQHGGRPIKWLGDGVMFFFDDPGAAVVAALEMVSGVAASGLPPAHVGVHSGEVVFQQGDYYGQTVNLAARIADFARQGEVLVSQEVVEASTGSPVEFAAIGPVELKGVAGAVRLYSARSKAA